MLNKLILLAFSTVTVLGQDPPRPRDCHEVRLLNSTNGIYRIYPGGLDTTGFDVLCILENVDQPENVILRRGLNGANVNFQRSFAEYQAGFGDKGSDTFWLGLNDISTLTTSGIYELYINITTKAAPNTQYAVRYQYFRVGNSSNTYKLYLDEYRTILGDPGNAFDRHNGFEFSAMDSDNDPDPRHCARELGGGWWYRDCFRCKLTGAYNGDANTGILWQTLPVNERLLSEVSMRVRRRIVDGSGGDGGLVIPTSCEDVFANGFRTSGRYQIFPVPESLDMSADVYCDFTNDEIWTVIQKRTALSLYRDFYLTWAEYEQGFGSFNEDGGFWVGLSTIHELTKANDMQLRVRLMNKADVERTADYSLFSVGDAASNYRLIAGGHSGQLGDSFAAYHNQTGFSTRDRNNNEHTENCAVLAHGGWWYKNCFDSNLNGEYDVDGARAVAWENLAGWM